MAIPGVPDNRKYDHRPSTALYHARMGNSIRRYLAEQTETATYAVSTNASIYYNIPSGKQVVITRVHLGCETAEEYAAAYLVSCTAVAGGGDATQLHAEMHDHVGSKKEGSDHLVRTTNPPIVVKYSSGARSISMAVKATDTATVMGYGWNGWVEDE